MMVTVTPKTRGAMVNVRKGMTGKAHEVIVRTAEDGETLEAELTKDGKWYRVDGGYIMAELARDARS